ncbi:MAG TPA: hypothetical protein VF331_02635 [Polyangiales bacterium]
MFGFELRSGMHAAIGFGRASALLCAWVATLAPVAALAQDAQGSQVVSAPAVPLAPDVETPAADAAPAAATPAPVAAPAPAPARPRVLLAAASCAGVEATVCGAIDAAAFASLERDGFAPTAFDDARAALAVVAAAEPPSVADLWRASYAAGAVYGVMFRASAEAAGYALEIQVAIRDGRGPFGERVAVSPAELSAGVERLLEHTLLAAARVGAVVPAAPRATAAATAAAVGGGPGHAGQVPALQASAAGPAATASDSGHLRLAAQTESAIGFSRDGFYNHLVGGRVDYRVSPNFSFGGYLAYANLRGRDGRVGSALYYLQIEQRIPIAPGSKLSIPLRLDLGYLVRNGSVLRVASGLAIPLGERFDLVFDLLAPTFWLTPERSLFSLDLAVELGVTF